METKYGDFRQVLVDLVGKRVRLCLVLAETDRVYQNFGWVKGVEDHTLIFENDPTTPGDYPIMTTRYNLESVMVYAVDEIPDDADLTEKPERKFQHVKSAKSVSWAEVDELLEQGYIIHETFAKTATLFLYESGREEGEGGE